MINLSLKRYIIAIILQIVLISSIAIGCSGTSVTKQNLNPVTPLLLNNVTPPDEWRNAYPTGSPIIIGNMQNSPRQVEFLLSEKVLPTVFIMNIYAIQQPMVTTHYIKEITSRLNLEGEIYGNEYAMEVLEAHDKMATIPREDWESIQPDDGVYGRAGGITFFQEKVEGTSIVKSLAFNMSTGNLQYLVIKRDNSSASSAMEGFLADDEVKRITYDFLNQVGLLPHDFGGFNTVKDKFIVSNKNLGGRNDYLVVEYFREVGDYPIIGFDGMTPDTVFKGRIANDGMIMNIDAEWLGITAIDSCEVVSAQKAYDNFTHLQPDLIHSDFGFRGRYRIHGECTKVIIKEMTPAYISGGFWLLPVYLFKGECLDANDNYIEDFTGWVEAIKME